MGGQTFFEFVREPRKDAASAKAQDRKKAPAPAKDKTVGHTPC
jgi:hypothetical protein